MFFDPTLLPPPFTADGGKVELVKWISPSTPHYFHTFTP